MRNRLSRIIASTRPRTTAVSWATTVRAIAVIAPSRNCCDVSALKKIAGSKFIDGRSARLARPGDGGASRGGLLDDLQVRRVEVVLRRDAGERVVVLQRLQRGLEGCAEIGLALAVVDPVLVV